MIFDPNGPGNTRANIFGFNYSEEESDIIIVPVPWDVTCSLKKGTSNAPDRILKVSPQLDFYHPLYKKAWEKKVHMLTIDEAILEESRTLGIKADKLIAKQEIGQVLTNSDKKELLEINKACEKLVSKIEAGVKSYLNKGKKAIVLGGDHSNSLGSILAHKTKCNEFGILQIDAHMDLRNTYEGFTHSHASVMYNVAEKTGLPIVEVGIRDCAPVEVKYAEKSDVKVFYDQITKSRLYSGDTWGDIVKEIIDALPNKVYLSIDIDGLKPHLCPNTGTPVPGGLEFEELAYLLNEVSKKKQIIGADLVEAGNEPWDGNVGARVLWEICQII